MAGYVGVEGVCVCVCVCVCVRVCVCSTYLTYLHYLNAPDGSNGWFRRPKPVQIEAIPTVDSWFRC